MPIKKATTLRIFGLLAALCMIGFVVGAWRTGPEAFVGWDIWVGRSIVLLLAAVGAVIEKRAQGGGIEFRAALKVTFGVLAIGIIAENLFVWLVINVFDPAFYQRLVPVMIEKAEIAYRRMGAPYAPIQQMIADIRANNQFSLGRVAQGAAFEFVPFFIVAVLIAATVKSKKGPVPAVKP